MDSIYLEYKGKKGDVTRYTTTIDTKQTLTEKGKNVYLVGDCLAIGNLRSVIWRAYEVAMKI